MIVRKIAVSSAPKSFDSPRCRNVFIEGNRYGEHILGKNVKMLHMKKSDLKLKDKEIIVLE